MSGKYGVALAALLLLVQPAQADLLGPEHAYMLERWVLIDTASAQAYLYQGEVPIAIFPEISIGSRGAAVARRYGDKTTPLGEFRIDRINRQSRFHIFLGIDYPRIEDAEKALQHGVIQPSEYWEYFERLLDLGRPPQDTALGGYIGIHGIGQGDPRLHGVFDWTRGCVALTNAQIERLASLVRVGTRVKIR